MAGDMDIIIGNLCMNNNITAVILAAGEGTRMKTSLPKVLHPVGSGTMLGKVISALKSADVTDIITVTGHGAEAVEDIFKKESRFVRQTELLGSGDALLRAVNSFDDLRDCVLVTCGDMPLISEETFVDLIRTHLSQKASCTLLTSIASDPSHYGRILRDKSGDVIKIVEYKDATDEEKKITEVNSGTYCFDKEDLEKFINNIDMNEKKQEFYLTDIIDILKTNGKKIASVSCSEDEAIGINTREDLAAANGIANRKKLDELMASGVTIMDPANTYIDDTAEVGYDTMIFPNTVIGSNVRIGSNCRIGPFARLEDGVKLFDRAEIGSFVELRRIEVGEGTKIKSHVHLSDTVVGRNVTISSGTATADSDSDSSHETLIEDDAFVGAGVLLIAPVNIDKGARVAPGTVMRAN